MRAVIAGSASVSKSGSRAGGLRMRPSPAGSAIGSAPVHTWSPLKSGDEWDAFTRWRRVVAWQRGELRRVKRAFGKRMRREAKDETRKGFV